jgi:hypothetical protein
MVVQLNALLHAVEVVLHWSAMHWRWRCPAWRCSARCLIVFYMGGEAGGSGGCIQGRNEAEVL